MQLHAQSQNGSSQISANQIQQIRNPFMLNRHIYYIPVYPRAFLQEIINIDQQRRTITAKFVLYITICIRVGDSELKKYLANHLILQFGYNQIIFIPEDITLQNSPFLITKMPMKENDDYVTYRVKGKIQCNAQFDSMFFPYRRIQISNHLCINSQQFRVKQQNRQLTIKYNFLTLPNIPNTKQSQFIAEFSNISFGSFKIDNNSFEVQTDIDSQHLKKGEGHYTKTIHTVGKIAEIKKVKQDSKIQKPKTPKVGFNRNQLMMDLKEEEDFINFRNQSWKNIEPYKHIVFRFEMSSIHLAFVLQQEVPIFMLSIVTLFLFHAQPNIGNKYSCIILLLVSYISVISSFRLNNIAQQVLTFYELKLMVLTLVPILLIISTRIDYYDIDRFKTRKNQIDNPFAYVSLVIVLVCFSLTLAFLVFVWIKRFFCLRGTEGFKKNMMEWGNMKDLEWKNIELSEKVKAYENGDSNLLYLFKENQSKHSVKLQEVKLKNYSSNTKAVNIKHADNTVQDS